MSTEAKKVEVELLVSHDVATGKTTCHDYRFNTVRELVKDPSLRVTDIAKQTGYNKGHVSRLRKESKREWVGLTPYEIQEIHLKEPHWGNFACAIEAKLKEKNA